MTATSFNLIGKMLSGSRHDCLSSFLKNHLESVRPNDEKGQNWHETMKKQHVLHHNYLR